MDSYGTKTVYRSLNSTIFNEKMKEEGDLLKAEKQWVTDADEWKNFHSGGRL
jgi:hypothetical protein